MKVNKKAMKLMRKARDLTKEYSPVLEEYFGVSLEDIKIREVRSLGCSTNRHFVHAVYDKNVVFVNAKMDGSAPPIEQLILHELAHAVYERLRGAPYFPDEESAELKWDEGFARYCSEILFRSLYPDKKVCELTGNDRDLCNVARHVERYGIEYLTKLPVIARRELTHDRRRNH